jgi:hypothetical protein
MLTEKFCSFLIILLFLNEEFLIKNFKFFKFVFCFPAFYFKSVFFLGKYYFSFILRIIKAVLIVSILPAFFQYSLIFHYIFNFIWDGYLLICIYFLLFSFPYYCYSFFMNNNIHYPRGFKYCLLCCIFILLDFDDAAFYFTLIFCYDFINNKLTKR